MSSTGFVTEVTEIQNFTWMIIESSLTIYLNLIRVKNKCSFQFWGVCPIVSSLAIVSNELWSLLKNHVLSCSL